MSEQNEGRVPVVAVSGVKNSGKTTFIEAVLPILSHMGLRVAVIKHDGHEFTPDVPGTDSYRYRQAGAWGSAIYSAGRFMVVKEEPGIDEQKLIALFPEADLILLEGLKDSDYKKIELVREGISKKCVCRPDTLLAVMSDLLVEPAGVRRIAYGDYEEAACLLKQYQAGCWGSRPDDK